MRGKSKVRPYAAEAMDILLKTNGSLKQVALIKPILPGLGA
jgi:hypothetical protein